MLGSRIGDGVDEVDEVEWRSRWSNPVDFCNPVNQNISNQPTKKRTSDQWDFWTEGYAQESKSVRMVW